MADTALNGLIGLAPPEVLVLDTGVWELGVSLSIALRDSEGVILLGWVGVWDIRPLGVVEHLFVLGSVEDA